MCAQGGAPIGNDLLERCAATVAGVEGGGHLPGWGKNDTRSERASDEPGVARLLRKSSRQGVRPCVPRTEPGSLATARPQNEQGTNPG